MTVLSATRMSDESWEDYYRFRWDALEATISYYSSLMEEWDAMVGDGEPQEDR